MIDYYAQKNKKGDPDASAEEARGEGRFLGFLGSKISHDDATGYDISSYSVNPQGDFVKLVGDGSVSSSSDQIYADPTLILEDGLVTGATASYVMSNNQKALIGPKQVADPAGGTPASLIVEWQKRARAGGVAEPGQFGLAELHNNETNYPVGSSLPSDLSLQLVDETAFKDYFHDLTTYSVGLQTNAATGGWKKDLSLFMEQYDELADENLITFKPTPETYIFSNKAVGNTSTSADALIYNWSGYREDNSNRNVWANIPPIVSWTALADYVGQYKDLQSTGFDRTVMPAVGGDISGRNAAARFKYLDQVRRSPQPAIIATPVVVLWNPYNVQLEWDSDIVLWIRETGVAPLNLEIEQVIGGSSSVESYSLINMLNEDSIALTLNYCTSN